mgnify:CR=1 FL=1
MTSKEQKKTSITHFQSVILLALSMNEVCLRFPHICELINTLLNDQSLVKFKETSRILYHSINNQKAGRFNYIRKIQSFLPIGKKSLFKEDWNSVLKIKSVNTLEIFAYKIKKHFKRKSNFSSNFGKKKKNLAKKT